MYFSEFRTGSKLHVVKIYFGTPTYDKITKDMKANFITKLYAIGNWNCILKYRLNTAHHHCHAFKGSLKTKAKI